MDFATLQPFLVPALTAVVVCSGFIAATRVELSGLRKQNDDMRSDFLERLRAGSGQFDAIMELLMELKAEVAELRGVAKGKEDMAKAIVDGLRDIMSTRTRSVPKVHEED